MQIQLIRAPIDIWDIVEFFILIVSLLSGRTREKIASKTSEYL